MSMARLSCRVAGGEVCSPLRQAIEMPPQGRLSPSGNARELLPGAPAQDRQPRRIDAATARPELLEEHARGRRGERPAEVKSLRRLTAELAQALELLLGLDALGDGVQPETAGDPDDGAHDRRIVRVGCHVANEGAVDLQSIDRQMLQIA